MLQNVIKVVFSNKSKSLGHTSKKPVGQQLPETQNICSRAQQKEKQWFLLWI
jgi:hypothetical protein